MSYTIKNLVENKILVKQKDAQKLSESGLIINAFNDNWLKDQIGMVVHVSDGVKDEDIIPGEFLFFSKYAGANLEFNGEKYIMLSETEVFGILESDTNFKVGDTLDTEGLLQALESHNSNLAQDKD